MAEQTIEDRLAALEAEVKQLMAHAQVQAALAGTSKSSGGEVSMSALMRSLDRHGIRIRPEDTDEAQGSGSERYADAGTWPETAGAGLTADTSAVQ